MHPVPEFSIVIPICNEEENIPLLYTQLVQVMEGICAGSGDAEGCFEIILVDDGSTDGSWQQIANLNTKDQRVKGLSFSKNFGHHVALTAGLDHVRGRVVILMDGDFQDPPEEIPKLLKKFREGFDLVYGIRQERNDPLMKKVSSNFFWWILRKFSGVDIPKGQTMLRILSRRLVDALKDMREQARFIHGMMAWAGFKTVTVEVKHNPRQRGTSKYDIPRMFKLAFHAVTSFSTVPLKLATYMGLSSSFISLFIGIYFLYKKLFLGIPIIGYASVIVAIFFVGGIQMLILGMFGEYLGRTYQEVQKRPLYIIRETRF